MLNDKFIDFKDFANEIDNLNVADLDIHRFYPKRLENFYVFISIADVNSSFVLENFIIKSTKRVNLHPGWVDRVNEVDWNWMKEIEKKSLIPIEIEELERILKSFACFEEKQKLENNLLKMISGIHTKRYSLSFENISEAAYWQKTDDPMEPNIFLFTMNDKIYYFYYTLYC